MELAVRLNLLQSSVHTPYLYNLLSVVPVIMVWYVYALTCRVNKPLNYVAVATLQCCGILTMLYHIWESLFLLFFFRNLVWEFLFWTWDDGRLKKKNGSKSRIILCRLVFGLLTYKRLTVPSAALTAMSVSSDRTKRSFVGVGHHGSRFGIYGGQSMFCF